MIILSIYPICNFILFISIPIIGVILGNRLKFGVIIGFTMGIIIDILIALFYVFGPTPLIQKYSIYILLLFIGMPFIGMFFGRRFDTDKKVSSGLVMGVAAGIILAVVAIVSFVSFYSTNVFIFYLVNYSIQLLLLFIGAPIIGGILGNRISKNKKMKIGALVGVIVGAIADIVIISTLIIGFSAQ